MMQQENWEIRLVRSSRRTMALQINDDLSITVRAPLRTSIGTVQRFVEEHADWIEKHIAKLKQQKEAREASAVPKMTTEELRELARQAMTIIPERVQWYAPLVGVTYGRITIRNQKTRWGSCSGKGNLNFNCLLLLMPQEILDYVVVHELCHRLEMNHSKAFWEQVEQVLPDYRKRRKWLKDHEAEYMSRMIP